MMLACVSRMYSSNVEAGAATAAAAAGRQHRCRRSRRCCRPWRHSCSLPRPEIICWKGPTMSCRMWHESGQFLVSAVLISCPCSPAARCLCTAEFTLDKAPVLSRAFRVKPHPAACFASAESDYTNRPPPLRSHSCCSDRCLCRVVHRQLALGTLWLPPDTSPTHLCSPSPDPAAAMALAVKPAVRVAPSRASVAVRASAQPQPLPAVSRR